MHVRGLTGLRFAAALGVLMHHLALKMPGLPGASLFSAGYVGVSFFFVLSGFVLTHAQADSSSTPEFYVRRVARVVPLHLVAAATTMAVLSRPLVPWDVAIANLTLVQAWSPNEAVAFSVVGAAWSLSCEIFFYALFPTAVTAVRSVRRPVGQACGLMLAMAAVGIATLARPALGAFLYHFPPVRFADFLVGVLLAEAMRRGWRPRVNVKAAVALTVLVYCAIVVGGQVGFEGPGRQWFLSALLVIPFGLVVTSVTALEQQGGSSLFGSDRWVVLGRWSFALYLVHGPVLGLVHAYLSPATGPGAWVVVAVALALCIAFAGAVHAVVERPAQRFVQRNGLRLVALATRRRAGVTGVDAAVDL